MKTRFYQRSASIEIMDDLQCSGEVVHQTLRELETINRVLGGNDVTIAGVMALLKSRSIPAEITIADWGCGGGDMLKRIGDWGKATGLRLRLTGIDANPNIVAFASNNCRVYPEINFETENVFSDAFRKRKFDIVLATLFTHHFSDDELIELFRVAKGQSRLGVVINDIHRHWLAYFSIRILTRLFSKSAMVRFDAPLSVLRAFRRKELEKLLRAAGIRNFSLRWKWAFRWQLVIPADQ